MHQDEREAMTMTANRPDWMLAPEVCPHNELASSAERSLYCETCDSDITEDAALEARFMEADEWQRDAFRAWHASGDYIADGMGLPVLSEFEERYSGEWRDFRDFADEMADECVIGGSEDGLLVRHFDYAAWARDLAFDYWTVPTEHGGVYVFRSL